jgi:hypothetical protein
VVDTLKRRIPASAVDTLSICLTCGATARADIRRGRDGETFGQTVGFRTGNTRTTELGRVTRHMALLLNVRFGSKADMCGAKSHVRFTPESGHSQCTSLCLLWAKSGHHVYSTTSSARPIRVLGTAMRSIFAVLRLIASSYFVDACTGRSAGLSPLRMRST